MKAKPRGTSRAPRTKPKAPKCQPRSAREDRMDYLAQQRLSKEAMSCQQFIWCCKSAILDQLARGEPPGGEQVFLQILLNEVVAAVRDTVAAGDVNTAQFLGNIQYVLSQARGVYGPKIEVPRVLSVARESLLREHSPREWIEVFDARQRVADLASLDGVRTARNYRLAPEHFDIGKLRKLTDAELEKWFFTAGVGIAKALVVSRGRESAEINKFIVLLQQGWFANGGPWQPCPWKGRAQLPALAEVKAFLRKPPRTNRANCAVSKRFSRIARTSTAARGERKSAALKAATSYTDWRRTSAHFRGTP